MANAKRSANKVGRYRNHMMIVSLLVLVLAIGCTVGGTLAWIVSVPDPVVNTFTYGDINITLEETDSPIDGEEDPENQNTYMMSPGATIDKDPKVTVLKGSEACWLFVKLEQSENFDDFMTYEMAEGWTELTGEDGVYFCKVTAEEVAEADAEFGVLKDDEVTVLDTVTKEMLNALEPEGEETAAYPTLTITAYAVQYMGFEPGEGETNTAAALRAWEAMEAQTDGDTTDTTDTTRTTRNTGGNANVSDAAATANAPRFDWGEDSIFTIDPKE